MVLEEEIPKFAAWIGPAFVAYLFAAGLVAVFAAALAWLVQSVMHGPLAAGDRVYRGVLGTLADLGGMSPRRIWALARLAVQESLRRNVLVVLGLFAVIILFAGWFLDPASVNPGKLYLGFILSATNLLVCLVVLVLSVFSLPADIKAKAIQTVTTKPVRTCEIVLGRMLGFALVGTVLLAVMGAVGWAFVVRSVRHEHELLADDVVEIKADDGSAAGFEGRTSLVRGHRHRVELDADGTGRTDTVQGHRHSVRMLEQGGVKTCEVGPPEGLLEARKPLRGTLRFLDRQGKPSTKGISVGAEWSYRQYIEGGSLAAAIWTFTGLTEREFPDGLPLEMIVRVFRTYKGDIEKGIAGSVRVRNPATGLQSDPIYFTAKEFTIDSLVIPRQVVTTTADGGTRQVDLFTDLVTDGTVEIVLQCLEPAQYYGVAQADFYLRRGSGSFAVNYAKSCLGAWFSMLLVTALGVMFSTFLAGPVALLATLAVVLVGQFREFIQRLFESQVTGDSQLAPGGGPIESLYRIVTQQSITLELDPSPAVTAMKAVDTLLLAPMRLGAAIFPSLSSLGTGDFLTGGFDIPFDLVGAHAAETLGYLLAFFVVGAVCLKAREVAA
ncbi:MAG: ABC transporter permease [Planctomycetia bacterium]|nr:ABC transporter permease [Planctomycetia bacterium]